MPMKDAIQEQLIAARRAQILDAAAKVFAQKGFHATTIKDIAKAAGIAEGTIYNYFENKTALLLGIFEAMRESLMPDADFPAMTADEMDVRTFVRAYLGHPLRAMQADHFELFRVVMSEILVNADLRDQFYQHILLPTLAMAEAPLQYLVDQHAQPTTKPVNVPLVLRAISGMVFGLILEAVMGDPVLEAHWEALPDVLTDLIIEGLGLETKA
jgi:TetR/AcrR family fatty acid metabolism transcriptional regulator